jgi:hypothetical protein
MSRIDQFVGSLTEEETLDAAGSLLEYLSMEQIIDLVLATLDDTAKVELLERLREELEAGPSA